MCEETFAKVRKTLQALGANNLQTPSTPRQTITRFSITLAGGVFYFMLNTNEMLPLLCAGPQGAQHSCSSSPSHNSTGFICSKRKALPEKVFRLCAILSIVASQIYPTNLPDQTYATLRGVQVQVCTEWKEPEATKLSKGSNSLCDLPQDLWEQRDEKIQTIPSAARYPSAFPLTEAGEAGNRPHSRTEQKHSSCRIWDCLKPLVEVF